MNFIITHQDATGKIILDLTKVTLNLEFSQLIYNLIKGEN